MEHYQCKNCGYQFSQQLEVCPECETSQLEETPNDNQLSKPSNVRKNNDTNILIIILGIITISLISFFIFFILKGYISLNNNSNSEESNLENIPPANSTSVDDSIDNKTEEAFESQSINDEKRYAMVINDADGWTNIRTAPSSKASIVDKVYDGTVFYVTYINGSKWCKFYWDESGSTAVGYIYAKYIKPVGSTKTPPNQQKVNSSYGCYHVIVGSYHHHSETNTMVNELSYHGYNPQVIYNSTVNAYRVSAYSSFSKTDAKEVLSDIKSYYPNAWLLSE